MFPRRERCQLLLASDSTNQERRRRESFSPSVLQIAQGSFAPCTEPLAHCTIKSEGARGKSPLTSPTQMGLVVCALVFNPCEVKVLNPNQASTAHLL